MANPSSPQNSSSNELDLLTDTTSNPAPGYYKHGLKPTTIPGTGTKMADQVVATHVGGAAIGSTDSLVTAAAKDNSGNAAPLNLDASGNLKTSGSVTVTTNTSATGTQTSVSASASSVTVLAANSSRKAFSVYNDSTVNLYLLIGTSPSTASTSAFTIKVPGGSSIGGFIEGIPSQVLYTGIIRGIWDSASGNARVTEWT